MHLSRVFIVVIHVAGTLDNFIPTGLCHDVSLRKNDEDFSFTALVFLLLPRLAIHSLDEDSGACQNHPLLGRESDTRFGRYFSDRRNVTVLPDVYLQFVFERSDRDVGVPPEHQL